jgi:hypothetical protein
MARINKTCRIGSIVRFQGQEVSVINVAGEDVQIKLKDGQTPWVNDSQLEHFQDGSTLKSFKACPLCKGETAQIMTGNPGHDRVFQCKNCGQRTSEDPYAKSIITTERGQAK